MRHELLAWFRTNAVPLAEAYEGAVRLIDDTRFPGRIHFIAHAVRDISDRLVYVLDPQLEGARVQYENELDWIASRWPNIMSVGDTTDSAMASETIEIQQEVAARIDSLVSAHRERRRRPSNYELLFRFLMRREPSQAPVNERLVRNFKLMRDWFMDLTHLRSGKPPDVNESELQARFRGFEGMLHSFVGSFFTGKKELDAILREANQ